MFDRFLWWKKRRNLIFLRVPRTAGQSVHSFMKDALNSSAGREYRYHQGHLGYGFHQARRFNDYTYITILRNPLNRLLSAFLHLRQRSANPAYVEKHRELVRDIQDISFLEWLKSTNGFAIDNLQTRLISGLDINAEYNKKCKISKWVPSDTVGPCGENHLETALRNLSDFAVLGIFEELSATMNVLTEFLCAQNTPWDGRHLNASPSSSKIDMTPDIEEFVREREQFDYRLFEHAKERFQSQISRR